MTTEDYAVALGTLAAESWRFAKDYGRLISRLDTCEQYRFANKLNYFLGRLESCLAESGLTLVSLEGQPYEIGIAADVLNLEEYSPSDHLIVEQMIEPVIMGPNGIVRMGKAMVGMKETCI